MMTRLRILQCIAALIVPTSSCTVFTGVEIATLRPSVKSMASTAGRDVAARQAPRYPLLLHVEGLEENKCTVKYSDIPLVVSGGYQLLQVRAGLGVVFDVTIKSVNIADPSHPVMMSRPSVIKGTCLANVNPDAPSYSFSAELTVRSRCEDVEWSISEDAPTCNIKIVVKPL